MEVDADLIKIHGSNRAARVRLRCPLQAGGHGLELSTDSARWSSAELPRYNVIDELCLAGA
jgi:hypothetical protein